MPVSYPIGLGDVLVLGLPAPRQLLDLLERQREVADQLGVDHRAGHARALQRLGRDFLPVDGRHHRAAPVRGVGPAPLVLEDFELMPIRPPGPEDRYDVIDERHEHLS